jgi:outer membrane murein-binding lipoprotein Lpp
LLVLALIGVAGCEGRAALHEMREQQLEMAREHQQWRAELERWELKNTEIERWHAEHPTTASGSELAGNVQDHLAKLEKHEEDMRKFREEVKALDDRIAAAGQQPERERITTHAAIWAEHIKLRTGYELLENTHMSLAREHDELSSDSSAARPRSGSY